MYWNINITKITKNIYVSNGPTAKNEEYLLKENFNIVINTAIDLSDYFKKKELDYYNSKIKNSKIKYYDFGIKDDNNTNLKPKIFSIARIINYNIIQNPNIKILINCCMGLSRSVSMVAGYLILKQNMDPLDAIYFIKSKRLNSFTNKNFVNQLLKLKNI